MLFNVTLSIGYPSTIHEDVIDVDTKDYESCETDEEREELLDIYWKYWASSFIDGSITIAEEN